MRRDLRLAKRQLVSGAIWFAAIELFDSQGYHGTTIDQIADRAGVSRRTFFRYFATKDAIAVFGADTYGDLIVEAIREAPRPGAPIDVVRAAVMRVAAFVVAEPHSRQAMRVVDATPEVKAAQVVRLRQVESRVAAEFQRALGLRRPHHPHATVLAGTTLMLIEASLRTWLRDGTVPLDRIVDPLVEAVRLFAVHRPIAPRPRPRVRRPVAVASI